MSSQDDQHPRKRAPPPPPKPHKGVYPLSAASGSVQQPPRLISSYLMNDIPRGTPRMKLINSLLTPTYEEDSVRPAKFKPDVMFGLVMTDSRLDDELSVALIEFSDTPSWLQRLSRDPYGFPKHTALGTLWRGVDRCTIDNEGKSEFIRAVIDGSLHLHYAEMLAEFEDTDVNIQDHLGRSALHWACALNLSDMVRLCLSVPQCDIGLKDNDGFTAFDLSVQCAGGNDMIPNLFYNNMLEIEENNPQTALLRALTVTSKPVEGRAKFPGAAIFPPINDCNGPLVQALIHRGVDLTAKNTDGDTALHVAAAKVETLEIATALLRAGSDVNAVGKGGATPLHYAANTGDEKMVQVLLDWDADVTAKDEDEKLALHFAAKTGKVAITQLLIDHGADLTATDIAGQTALEVAVGNRQENVVVLLKEMEMRASRSSVGLAGESRVESMAMAELDGDPIRLLLEHCAENVNDRRQHIPLHLAVKKGDTEILKALLTKGINLEEVDYYGYTALHLGAEIGYTEIVKELFISGAHVDALTTWKRSPLHLAAVKGHGEIVQILLDNGADIELADRWNRSPLHLAAAGGAIATIPVLMVGGAEIEAEDLWGRRPLNLAVTNGHIAMVNTLLVFQADIEMTNDEGQRALHLAAAIGHPEICNTLVVGGAELESLANKNTALHEAASRGHTAAVNALVACGAQIEAKSDRGETALHMAGMNGHTGVVIALLGKGAKIEAADFFDETALQMAASRGHPATVNALLAGGAKIEGADNRGQTALHMAASEGHTATVDALLAGGANSNAADCNGETVLHMAAGNLHTKIVITLLASGAKVDAANSNARTALHVAAMGGDTEVVKALLVGGAPIEARYSGETALQLALRHGHGAVAQELLAAGAITPTAGRLRDVIFDRLRLKGKA